MRERQQQQGCQYACEDGIYPAKNHHPNWMEDYFDPLCGKRITAAAIPAAKLYGGRTRGLCATVDATKRAQNVSGSEKVDERNRFPGNTWPGENVLESEYKDEDKLEPGGKNVDGEEEEELKVRFCGRLLLLRQHARALTGPDPGAEGPALDNGVYYLLLLVDGRIVEPSG
ncbi:hypothetical protein Dda_4494 [Drechslerella dactyloides]|uniref:Uncharacterized protein n=1 Tax=Drechslerella dactyloides TaxID=74499 RepID=A0AAD6IX11_DREDA|nr:hypothetical protein Dda_4494 [Drechslerella dactyloides]